MTMQQANDSAAKLTDTGIPIRNLWHMLLYAWDVPRLQDHWKSDVEAAPTLDALLASILANLIQQRMRIGLGRDYRSHEAEVGGIRGRVDFNQSLKLMSFQHGKAYCRYSVYSPNIVKNQIIRGTLARVVQLGEFGPNAGQAEHLRSRMRRLVADLEGIDPAHIKGSDIKREMMKRHDADYLVMLAICDLLQQRLMPTEDAGINRLPLLSRDALTLYDVYEKFVFQFYRHRLIGWTARPQTKFVWETKNNTSPYLPTMKPDITLVHHGTRQRVVIDTKFTAKSLVSGRYGNQIFDPSHLYQMYAYLRSQESQAQEYESATGTLLYPNVGQRLSEEVEIQGHRFRWETVDLAQPWQEVEEQLLAIPASTISNRT